jgi:hypothetical protein
VATNETLGSATGTSTGLGYSSSRDSVSTANPSAKPGEEVITEPKFKNNLMDFDITKYGAPPPKARLTKEEDTKREIRKAEKLRLKQLKETSLQKARDSTSRLAPSYETAIQNYPDPLQSDKFASTPVTKSTSSTSTPASISMPSAASSSAGSVSEKSGQPPSVPHRESSPSSVSAEQQATAPKPFQLPDISMIQPPPMAHPKRVDSSTSNAQAVPSRQQYTGYSPHSSFASPTEQPPPAYSMQAARPNPPAQTPAPEVSYDRPNMPSPPRTESAASSTSASTTSVLSKKQPPPKPAKLVSPNAPSPAHGKAVKTPPVKPPKPAKPPKPSKPAAFHSSTTADDSVMSPVKPPKPQKPQKLASQDSVGSSAKGDHIKELQARLGNLSFQ